MVRSKRINKYRDTISHCELLISDLYDKYIDDTNNLYKKRDLYKLMIELAKIIGISELEIFLSDKENKND